MQSPNSDQTSSLTWDQLVSYVTGSCPVTEQLVEQWLAANPDGGQEIRRLRALWCASWHEPSMRDTDVDAIWTSIAQRMSARADASPPSVTSPYPPSYPPSPSTHAIEAGMARADGAYSNVSDAPSVELTEMTQRPSATYRRQPSPGMRVSRAAMYWSIGVASALCLWVASSYTRPSPSSVSPFPAMIRSSTLPGQRAQVTLPDGTEVTLNVASQLEIPSTFGQHDRTVYLTGEALFRVVHKVDIPLTVMTGSVSTRVLGTTFSVRRYTSDTTTAVAVRDGKVVVQSVVVTPGYEVIVGDNGEPQIQTVSDGRFTYADGVLTLPWMSLADALKDLERWANVRIRIASPGLAERRVKLSVPEGSPSDIAGLLEAVLGVRVVRNKDTLTLYSND